MKPSSLFAHNKFVSVLLMAVSLAAAAAQPAVGTLAARVDAHIGAPRFAAADWGIAVVSLDDGRTLYTHHADRLLQPASTAKLFTAALALSTLGADYRLPTRLLAGGAIANGRLDGPLILYGMGDPTLGAADTSADWADQLASQLAERGIRRVHGHVIADDSYFRGPLTGSGWEVGDLQSAFAAPASALSVNESSVTVTVTPAARTGQPAQLALDPADAGLLVENGLVTVPARTPDDINLYRAPDAMTLQAFGSVAMDTAPRQYTLSLPDPAALAGARLLQALRHRHIRVDGKLQVRHWPQGDGLASGAGVIAEVLSPPLGEILRRGLKRSQNLYLQNLLLAVGASPLADPPASTGFVSSEQRAIETLHHLLDRIGIPPSASVLVEGSGLARRDLVTPNALVRLQVYLAAQPQAALLHESLPIAGVDGSLAWRMRGTTAEGNVHAKTGSVAYVQCLAGYVTTAAGERLAFAIMLNNYVPVPGAPHPSAEVDAIAVMLANLTDGG
jgi:D-alanyl-D-alanine carboxypeptidase/D-alanyl-D-alanine-endopeptidase (penicillin-binding protein 4)